uniref:Putative secreted protein n=1 Tax=Ixodes ricinus TaxID=34613 RepID=A0A6B0U3E8_IXORI
MPKELLVQCYSAVLVVSLGFLHVFRSSGTYIPHAGKRRRRVRANSVRQCTKIHVRSRFSTVFNAMNLKEKRRN